MIQTEIRGSVGILTLDRQSALNTLNLEMVTVMLEQLHAWESDPTVSAIVLRGAGPRSFCSGGDVKSVYVETKKGNLTLILFSLYLSQLGIFIPLELSKYLSNS